MSDEAPPIRVTLVGREKYEPEFDEDALPPEGTAIPSGCLRHLNIPGHVCEGECAGRQRDGSCLAELVKAAPAGWSMTLDDEGFWNIHTEGTQ